MKRSTKCAAVILGVCMLTGSLFLSACNSHTLEISKHCIPSPFAILRVDYADGTSETIKLKP